MSHESIPTKKPEEKKKSMLVDQYGNSYDSNLRDAESKRIVDPKGNLIKAENVSAVDEVKMKEHIKKQALEALKQKVSIVNVNHLAEMEARDAADAHMTADKKKIGFFKRLWKHTFFDEYYRQKELNKVRDEIYETRNIYTAVDKDRKAHESAMNAIATRFISEYEEAINKKAGEDKDTLDEGKAQTIRTKMEIKKIIFDYAEGKINEDVFNSEKERIFRSLHHDLINEADLYADNLFEMAKNARLAIEHGAKIKELDEELDFNIVVGKAKSSIKTEAKYSGVDRVVAGLKKTKIGRFVNPATLSTAVAIAYSISVASGKMLVRNKVSHAVTLGGTIAVSAALAAVNESQRLAEERRQHEREMAKGGTFEAGSPRRESMQEYSYEKESAVNLIRTLRDSLFVRDTDGNEVPRAITASEVDAILGQIASLEARNSIADSKNIDLISYSHITHVEKERTELTILLARSKVELRKQLESSLKGSLPDGETFDSYLAKQTAILEKALLGGEKGVTSKDKAFKWLKLKRSSAKAIRTAIMGTVVGAIGQEVVAGVDGVWGGQREGIVEGLMHNGETTNNVQTPLEHIRGWITGNPSHISMANAHEQILDGNHFKLPEGVNIVQDPSGAYSVIQGDHIIADHLELHADPSGALDQASIEKLGTVGIIANVDQISINSTQEVTHTAEAYIKNHPEATTRIARDGWYDNNTPKPVFDQNELKLHWGGEHGTGVNANGDYVFNVSHMTSGGSFHGNLSVDAQEKIKDGGLKMLFSLSRDTQNQVFEVPIDANGNAIIDPKSEIGKLFFSTDANGHTVFSGKFAEVAETFGDKSGVEHVRVLATHVGEGINTIKDTIPSHEEVAINNLQIPLETEAPYFIPFIARRPLEKIAYKNSTAQKDATPIPPTKEKPQEKIPDIPAGGFLSPEAPKREIVEMSEIEYGGLEDDIKMLNKRIQESQGIITLEEDDFVSDYGRQQYNKLKSILAGVPVSFNKTELQKIGNEMEEFIVSAKKHSLLSFKDLKSGLDITERRLKVAEELNDTDAIEFLRNRAEKMKKAIKTHDAQMKKLKLKLKEAEDAKKEDDIVRLEGEIKKLEKKKFKTGSFS
jgi:hypothetical protein